MTDTTPRPWHIGNFEGYVQYLYANTPKFEQIAKDLKPADAALIVTAVNAHGDLVKALEEMAADYEEYVFDHSSQKHDMPRHDVGILERARSALAKAKGETK